MPVRLCLTPGCANTAVYRGRCAEHARRWNIESHPDPAKRAVYNSMRWRILRDRILFENPLCACGCGMIATDVDHIRPLENGGAPYDPGNLQALAHNCHSRKTRREQRA